MVNKIKSLFKSNVTEEQNLLEETRTRLQEELQELNVEIQQKLNNFNNADSEFVEIAIMELEAVRKKYDAILKQYKQLAS